MENTSFIMIHNNLIKEKSNQHLSIKELYLFCYLYMDLYYSGSVKTTVTLISTFLPVSYSKKKEDNLKEIKETLLNLQTKELITMVNQNGEKISSKFRANDGIMIHLLENDTSGFTMVTNEKYFTFDNMKYFYIYVLVARWNMSTGGYFECDYDRWSRLLDCSRNTAIKYIDEAVEKGIIYKNIGDYKEEVVSERPQKKQSLNQYKTIPFTAEEKTAKTRKEDYLIEKEENEKVVRDSFIVKQKEEAPTKKEPIDLVNMF